MEPLAIADAAKCAYAPEQTLEKGSNDRHRRLSGIVGHIETSQSLREACTTIMDVSKPQRMSCVPIDRNASRAKKTADSRNIRQTTA